MDFKLHLLFTLGRTQDSVTVAIKKNSIVLTPVLFVFVEDWKVDQHGNMSAIVSLLCISMFAVLWYI